MKTLCIALVLLSCLVANAQTPRGDFVLQGVDNANVSDDVIRRSDGLSIRFSWASVDGGNWSWVDKQILRAVKLNRPVMLRMMTGNNSRPARYATSMPWNEAAKNRLAEVIWRMGQRYSNNPSVHLVHLSSTANHKSAEMHLDPVVLGNSNYSDKKIVDAWKWAINAYSIAFPTTPLSLNASPEPPGGHSAITNQVVAHCQQTLAGRATFQHNSLKASTGIFADHHVLILNLGKQGWRTGFQAACRSDDRARFGGTVQEAIQKAGPDADYFEWYQSEF